jgi:precorrin-6B methylase 2
MRLVMTVLVRDEADVIEAMLESHYALGVDFVIATDHRSEDGTTAILERYQRQGRLRLIHEPDDVHQQARWVTRMARLAAVDHDADWVINADADEWWWPRDGDLASTFTSLPDEVTVLVAQRYNFVLRPDDGRPFHERMQWRRTDSLTQDGDLMAVKVAHRASPEVEVAVGNHAVSGLGGRILDDGRIEVLHFPVRSWDQYERKIRLGMVAVEHNTSYGPEVFYHWRRSSRLLHEGRLAEEWASWVYDDDALARAVAAGEVVADDRVAGLLATLPAPPIPAVTPAPPTSSFSGMPSPGHGVRRLGAGVSYADGAEDDVLAVLRKVEDTSSGSVELAEHIVDWPTCYHFSPQRSNLLRPLNITSSLRILDVGAGSGVLTRYLAEQGATVVALEANPRRADAAAERCRDLDRVDVIAGTLEDLDAAERFDLVLLVGVLEYAGSAIGGGCGASEMLRHARSHLSEGGAVVVATENQLGLKYLLGAREDHLGEPWVSIDGYPGPAGVRTWTRAVLRELLNEAGLDRQHWLAPFPDYKHPTVVLDERLYARPDAAELIDQLVLHPVVCMDQPPVRAADGVGAHRVWAEAGLAAEVANSFLVVAGTEDTLLHELVDERALAWLYGGNRVSRWRRERMLTIDDEMVTLSDSQPRHVGWLGQDPGQSRPYRRGRTLAQDAMDALRAHDLDGLATTVQRWRTELEARAVDITGVPNGAHPFLLPDSTRGLPDGHLDVGLANFVDTGVDLAFIDDEWRTAHPVDVRLAEYRALWVLAHDVLGSGIAHPWGDEATVDEIVARLASLARAELHEWIVDAFQAAETELQGLVAGEPPERLVEGWLNGGLRAADLYPRNPADAELRYFRDEEILRLCQEIDALGAERERLVEQRTELTGQIAHFQGVVAAHRAEIDRLHTVRGFLSHWFGTIGWLRTLIGRGRRSGATESV